MIMKLNMNINTSVAAIYAMMLLLVACSQERTSPFRTRLWLKHTFAQAPQRMHNFLSNWMYSFPSVFLAMVMAFWGQTFAHRLHPIHLSGKSISSGPKWMFSGLAHHRQRSGQPLVKIRLRMPGPSWTLNFWMFVTIAEGFMDLSPIRIPGWDSMRKCRENFEYFYFLVLL